MELNMYASLTALCLTLYFTFLKLGWLAPLKLFFPFSFVILTWGWLGGLLPISYRNFQMAALPIFLYFLTRGKNRRNLLHWKDPLSVVLPIFVIGFIVLRSNGSLLFSILTSGYDHNGHIAHFYRTYVNNGFSFGLNPNLISRNAILENGYPPLQMGSWAFLMRVFGFEVSNSTELINTYVFFNIITYFFIIYIVTLSFLSIFSKYLRRISMFVTVSLLIFTKLSTLLVSGFPPTFFGILVLLCGLYLIRESTEFAVKLNYLIFTMLFVIYSYHLFALALIPILILALVQLKQNIAVSGLQLSNLASLLLGAFFVLPLIPISRAITGYVWDFGGIEIPDIQLISLLLFLLFISLLFKGKLDLYETTSIFTIISAATMIIYANRLNVGNYYAIKLLYAGLFLALLSVPRILNTLHSKKKIVRNPIYVLITIILLATAQSSLHASFPNSNLGQIARSYFVEKSLIGDPCASQLLEAAKMLGTFGDFQSYTFIDTEVQNRDLRTRWLNSLNGKMTNPVFDISIPLGTSQSVEKVVSSWKINYPLLQLNRYSLKESDCGITPR